MFFSCKISLFSCDLGSIHRQQSEIVEQKFKKQNMMLALASFSSVVICLRFRRFCSNVQTIEKDKDPYFEKAT